MGTITNNSPRYTYLNTLDCNKIGVSGVKELSKAKWLERMLGIRLFGSCSCISAAVRNCCSKEYSNKNSAAIYYN